MKLKPEWRYAAMDEDGGWCFYKDAPERGEEAWDGEDWEFIQSIFILPEIEDWTKSLHTITEEGELVPYVDIPADGEKVMVRECGRWYRRYSTGRFRDGRLLCYECGGDKWSAEGTVASWEEWRRPTEEELN